MATHLQFQIAKHVMRKQTAHFTDGATVLSLLMKVNTNAMIQKVSLFSVAATSLLSIKIILNIRDQNLKICWRKMFIYRQDHLERISGNFDYLRR